MLFKRVVALFSPPCYHVSKYPIVPFARSNPFEKKYFLVGISSVIATHQVVCSAPMTKVTELKTEKEQNKIFICGCVICFALCCGIVLVAGAIVGIVMGVMSMSKGVYLQYCTVPAGSTTATSCQDICVITASTDSSLFPYNLQDSKFPFSGCVKKMGEYGCFTITKNGTNVYYLNYNAQDLQAKDSKSMILPSSSDWLPFYVDRTKADYFRVCSCNSFVKVAGNNGQVTSQSCPQYFKD